MTPIGDVFGIEIRKYEYSVLEFCEELRGHLSRGSDFYYVFPVYFMYSYLKYRLSVWDGNPNSPWAPFDNSVKNLVEIVISEFEKNGGITEEEAKSNYEENKKHFDSELEKRRRC